MMAVVPPFPSASKVRSWARSEPTVFRPGPKSPCKSSRSSQHPSQSLRSEATSAQNNNNAKARKMSQHNGSSAAMDHHAVLGWKERRDSTSMLKRSYSTPAVKTMSSSVSSDQSSQPSNSGEKRRNKLGYHRTSIACTHCRRRKIRCIVSVDMENRCINCVRLKKDCSFQPVDQLLPPPSDHRHDSIQGQPIVPILASNSPALAIGGVNLPNGSVQDELRRARMPEHSRSIPVLMSDGSSEFSTDYEASGISNQGGIPWTSSAPGTATMANANDMGMRWQQMESPAGDSFSSFGPGSTGVPAWSSGTSGSVSGEDWPWTPSIPSTTRSMSFSGEFLPGQGSQMTPCQGLDPGSAGYSELFSNSMNAAAIHGTVMHTNTGLQAAPGILGQAAWGPDAFRKPRVDFGNWQFPNSGDGTHL